MANIRVSRKKGGGGNPPGAGNLGGPNPQNPLTDLAAFPVLTEEVGFPPSPLAKSGGTTGGGYGAPGGSGLGQTAAKAIADVLGWKTKPNDPKAFLGALTQSFTLTEVEGRVESKWMQRSYAVQTDLSGGISGAQASLYTRARYMLDQSLPPARWSNSSRSGHRPGRGRGGASGSPQPDDGTCE